jgi:hypothetical protein
MVSHRKVSAVPHSGTIKKRLQMMGGWGEYLKYREDLRKQGMQPAEAKQRAYKDLGIEEKWQDHLQRKSRAEILGRDAPLTPGEMVSPGYKRLSVTQDAIVGDQVLSLPEQVRWVKQQLARVRNGGDQPVEFPSADVLYWYQIAMTRPTDFDKIVLKIESPERESEDAMMRDGEYQFAEIEEQLRLALNEVGVLLREIEANVARAFHGVLPAGSEGSGVESPVSAGVDT